MQSTFERGKHVEGHAFCLRTPSCSVLNKIDHRRRKIYCTIYWTTSVADPHIMYNIIRF